MIVSSITAWFLERAAPCPPVDCCVAACSDVRGDVTIEGLEASCVREVIVVSSWKQERAAPHRRWARLLLGCCLVAVLLGAWWLLSGPEVAATTIAEGEGGVPIRGDRLVAIEFSRPMKRDSVHVFVLPGESHVHHWRRGFELWWEDDVTIVVSPGRRNGPRGALAADTEYTVGATGRDRLGRRLRDAPAVSFRTEPPVVRTPDDAARAARDALESEHSLCVPKPPVVHVTEPGVSYWTSVVFHDDAMYRVHVLDDGTTFSQSERDPLPRQGRIRVIVLGVARETNDLAETFSTRWVDAQEEVNRQLREYAQRHGLERAPIQFENVNVLLDPDELGDGTRDRRRDVVVAALDAAVERAGVARGERDVVVLLDLDPDARTGGRASTRAMVPGGSDAVTVGCYWGDGPTCELDTEWAGFLAGTVYQHEIAHIFGWEHEWVGAPSEATPEAWHGHGWESPSLLGWTDVDGDGVIEIWDETPYGGVSRCADGAGGPTHAARGDGGDL